MNTTDEKGTGMTLNRKKKAAIAAVAHYLKTETEAAGFSSAAVQPSGDEPAKILPMDMTGPWAISGRLHQMQLRTMMQWKGFHDFGRR
jgi:hypothetical protein